MEEESQLLAACSHLFQAEGTTKGVVKKWNEKVDPVVVNCRCLFLVCHPWILPFLLRKISDIFDLFLLFVEARNELETSSLILIWSADDSEDHSHFGNLKFDQTELDSNYGPLLCTSTLVILSVSLVRSRQRMPSQQTFFIQQRSWYASPSRAGRGGAHSFLLNQNQVKQFRQRDFGWDRIPALMLRKLSSAGTCVWSETVLDWGGKAEPEERGEKS